MGMSIRQLQVGVGPVNDKGLHMHTCRCYLQSTQQSFSCLKCLKIPQRRKQKSKYFYSLTPPKRFQKVSII